MSGRSNVSRGGGPNKNGSSHAHRNPKGLRNHYHNGPPNGGSEERHGYGQHPQPPKQVQSHQRDMARLPQGMPPFAHRTPALFPFEGAYHTGRAHIEPGNVIYRESPKAPMFYGHPPLAPGNSNFPPYALPPSMTYAYGGYGHPTPHFVYDEKYREFGSSVRGYEEPRPMYMPLAPPPPPSPHQHSGGAVHHAYYPHPQPPPSHMAQHPPDYSHYPQYLPEYHIPPVFPPPLPINLPPLPLPPPHSQRASYERSPGREHSQSPEELQRSANSATTKRAVSKNHEIVPPEDGEEFEEGRFLDLRRRMEMPTRTLFIRHVSFSVKRDQLRRIFSKYGPVKELSDIQHEKRGMYDIRHAEEAKKALQNFTIYGLKWDVHFSLPKKDREIDGPCPRDRNQGTVIVTILGGRRGWTNDDLRSLLERAGEIKAVRDLNNQENRKLVEYFDTRAAEEALVHYNGKLIRGGNRIVMKQTWDYPHHLRFSTELLWREFHAHNGDVDAVVRKLLHSRGNSRDHLADYDDVGPLTHDEDDEEGELDKQDRSRSPRQVRIKSPLPASQRSENEGLEKENTQMPPLPNQLLPTLTTKVDEATATNEPPAASQQQSAHSSSSLMSQMSSLLAMLQQRNQGKDELAAPIVTPSDAATGGSPAP